MSRSLFVFRRDLRLSDNTALNAAIRDSEEVVTAFIIDSSLLAKWTHATRRLAFLFQSVAALGQQLKERGGQLVIRIGDPTEEIGNLLTECNCSALYLNREYSPLGQRRDEALAAHCQAGGIRFNNVNDIMLNPPGAVLKKDGLPYTVFTPYFNKAREYFIGEPDTVNVDARYVIGAPSLALNEVDLLKQYMKLELDTFEPGVAGAARALEKLPGLQKYFDLRDVPASAHTSMLSAHLRFGTCSPREVYQAVKENLGIDHDLIRQLYWRDFYLQIGVHFPHVFRHAFRRRYDAIPWVSDEEKLKAWCAGRTGFPLIDAGMRELMATGYMHNRVRMVVASFLTKNLRMDWRVGEAHFARYLIDYEPAVNNGNWQWGASTGCDAQPYFRVFNPWRQQQKFDRDCAYIKHWVPELAPYPAKAIHALEKGGDYYLPVIVDLRESAAMIKDQFRMLSAG